MTYLYTCQNCGRQIHIAIFRGTGFCSVNCQKAFVLKNEKDKNG